MVAAAHIYELLRQTEAPSTPAQPIGLQGLVEPQRDVKQDELAKVNLGVSVSPTKARVTGRR